MQTEGEPLQAKPASIVQLALQPSPLIVLPSSQFSSGVTTPSPQMSGASDWTRHELCSVPGLMSVPQPARARATLPTPRTYRTAPSW